MYVRNNIRACEVKRIVVKVLHFQYWLPFTTWQTKKLMKNIGICVCPCMLVMQLPHSFMRFVSYCSRQTRTVNRDSSVGIVIRLRAGRPSVRSLIRGRSKYSLLQSNYSGSSMWDLWWTERQLGRCLSGYFGCPLSASFHKCWILIHSTCHWHCVILATESVVK